MDVDRAKRACDLLGKRDFIRRILDEATTILAVNPVGTATITIPRSWLPAVVELAKDELGKVDEEIAKL